MVHEILVAYYKKNLMDPENNLSHSMRNQRPLDQALVVGHQNLMGLGSNFVSNMFWKKYESIIWGLIGSN